MRTSIRGSAMTSPATTVPQAGGRARAVREALRGVPLLPAVILLAVVVGGVFGPLLAPYNPEENDLLNAFLPAIWQPGGGIAHVFGTDQFGRDVLSRLIVGARISLLVGCLAVFFSGFIGTSVALLAGYLGGTVDAV